MLTLPPRSLSQVNCPFYLKMGACRHGDRCSRIHNRPILSQTLQATRAPDQVLDQLLRIGRHAIVSFPNFAYWRVRLSLMFAGRMPTTRALPASWYETENIHFCTIDDFRALIGAKRLTVERARFLTHGRPRGAALANLMAEQAIFVLRR